MLAWNSKSVFRTKAIDDDFARSLKLMKINARCRYRSYGGERFRARLRYVWLGDLAYGERMDGRFRCAKVRGICDSE